MTAAVRCPSHSPVEICCILGFNSGRNGLIILDGCGYCDDSGQCRCRGGLHRREPGVPEYRRERREQRKERKERKERREHRRQRRRGQVSLHAFLGRC